MKLGVAFPTNEIGNDPDVMRDWAQAAEDIGYDFVEVYDHVLSYDPEPDSPARDRPYNSDTPWHEPFVTMGFLAACTSRVQFLTGVLVLPQRQTALVAKQAAEVDILSRGRLMLGVGIGWNDREYEGLGLKDSYRARGRRTEEQVALMRRLWTEPVVTFEGEFDRVQSAGINPRPERSIPVWLGGHAPRVLDRVGRIADGWVAGWARPEIFSDSIERIRAAASAAGRDPGTLGFETRARIGRWTPDQQAAHAERCREAGATHFGLHTLDGSLVSPQQHIDAMRAFHEAYTGS